MRGGRLIPFSPEEVSGYSTPVITQHLPTGSITYNANGVLDVNLHERQTGGRYKRTNKKKRTVKRSKKSKKRTNKKKRTIKRSNTIKRRY